MSQTYSGSAKSVTVTAAPPGVSYTVTYINANGNAIASPVDAGRYTVIATATNPNYVGFTSATLVIARAQISVSGIVANAKVYDGTTDATIDASGATLTGVVAGDDVTLNAVDATGSFDNPNVGTAKTVTVSGLSLSGSAAGNYVLMPTTMTTANITAATVTVSGITANNKGYDGTTAATLNTAGATLVGVVSGDQVTLNTASATGQFDSPDVGTGKTVTVSGLTLSGSDAGNYTLVQPTTTADITLGTLTVTGITAANKVYDGTTDATLNTSEITLVGLAPGDDVALDTSAITGSFDTKNVGPTRL